MERSPQNLVVDASAAVKWFVPEAEVEKAVKLRDKHIEGTISLFAPDVLVYEIANALRHRPELSDETLKEDVEALFMLDLELIVPSSDFIKQATLKARQLGITVYLIIAETIGSYAVTADENLYGKVKQTGLVKFLRDFDVKWTI